MEGEKPGFSVAAALAMAATMRAVAQRFDDPELIDKAEDLDRRARAAIARGATVLDPTTPHRS